MNHNGCELGLEAVLKISQEKKALFALDLMKATQNNNLVSYHRNFESPCSLIVQSDFMC